MKDYIKWVVLFVIGLIIFITGMVVASIEASVIGVLLLIAGVTGEAIEYCTKHKTNNK